MGCPLGRCRGLAVAITLRGSRSGSLSIVDVCGASGVQTRSRSDFDVGGRSDRGRPGLGNGLVSPWMLLSVVCERVLRGSVSCAHKVRTSSPTRQRLRRGASVMDLRGPFSTRRLIGDFSVG